MASFWDAIFIYISLSYSCIVIYNKITIKLHIDINSEKGGNMMAENTDQIIEMMALIKRYFPTEISCHEISDIKKLTGILNDYKIIDEKEMAYVQDNVKKIV